MEKVDLSICSTEEIIKELLGRCKPAVFIGTRNEGQEGYVDFWRMEGNKAVCYGMCHQLALHIQSSFIKDEINDED